MESYSQVGQDRWVLSLFPEGYKGFFLDIGCYLPDNINNTFLLEQHGWDGIAFDIEDYSKQWQSRKARFICTDVLNFNFVDFRLPFLIDYLSLDIDYNGGNYMVLKNFIDSGYEFKAITIEHNLYLPGYNELERIPQRELLTKKGYSLAYPDVCSGNNPFEDWWTNGLDTGTKI